VSLEAQHRREVAAQGGAHGAGERGAQDVVEVARDHREEQLLPGQRAAPPAAVSQRDAAVQRAAPKALDEPPKVGHLVGGEAPACLAADGPQHARDGAEDVDVERIPA
jgi:hypothetical protein